MEDTRSGPGQRPDAARLRLVAPARLRSGAAARPRLAMVLAVVMVGCVILVAALGALFAGQSTPDPFDRAVDSVVITWFAGHHGLALWLAFPGTTLPAVVLSVVIAVACLLTRRIRGALLAVAAAVELCEVLIKPLVHRTYIGQVVYPSGHTAAISALAATITVLLLAPPRPAVAPSPGASGTGEAVFEVGSGARSRSRLRTYAGITARASG